jgi:hypothetical protein
MKRKLQNFNFGEYLPITLDINYSEMELYTQKQVQPIFAYFFGLPNIFGAKLLAGIQ